MSQVALERDDFKRTNHPIYSFAVWGKDQEYLCSLNNRSAFGEDSPFAFFRDNHVKNIIINVNFANSFTFVHFVEEEFLKFVPYRYMKNFRSNYIDEEGICSKRVYSMCVRSYWYDVVEEVDFFEDEFIEKKAQENVYINGLKFAIIDLAKAYPIIKKDILENRSRKLCTWKGQNSELSVQELMYGIVEELFPLCRSITGDGFRNSVEIIKSYVPELQICEVKSGTRAFDWTVPAEWNISDAYIENETGDHIIDFKQHNLHVMGYSTPVDQWMNLEELKQHIYVQEDQPDVIPYVTSYYKERWGFCMSKNMLDSLKNGQYHAVIRSELDQNGSLTYGEAYYPGESKKEILISTYLCHPSMANNECSGPAVSALLAKYVSNMKRRKYGYRFLYIPETIGSITWLSKNYERLQMKDRVIAGFVLTCVGDERTYSFVHTRYGNTLTDKLLKNILSFYYPEYQEYSFLDRGSDERQYNAPGIELPVCSVCRSKFRTYPEYHTSADDLSLVTEKGLLGTYNLMRRCIDTLEYNEHYKINLLCEPQLGGRGLYPTVSQKGNYDSGEAILNFIAYCDGKNDLIDISNQINIDTAILIEMIKKLDEFELLDRGTVSGRSGKRTHNIKVGDCAEKKDNVTYEKAMQYSLITGDNNPIHFETPEAYQSRYGKPIAHGMILAGYISGVIGGVMPGGGCIYVKQTLNFKRPVFYGDTITTRVTVSSIDTVRNYVTLQTECFNQKHELVLEGEAIVI